MGSPRLNSSRRNDELALLEDKNDEVEVNWPKRASRMKRKQEARRALPEEIIRLDVDWRHLKGADFPHVTIPAELWSNLVLMAMKASY